MLHRGALIDFAMASSFTSKGTWASLSALAFLCLSAQREFSGCACAMICPRAMVQAFVRSSSVRSLAKSSSTVLANRR